MFSNDHSSISVLLAKNTPLIMGIMNITSDSFSDGFEWKNRQHKLDILKRRLEAMLVAGADIIDIGGESTRPNAEFIEPEREADRILDVIVEIKKISNIVVSVDTYKPEIMHLAVDAGADMVNDVTGAINEQTQQILVKLQVPVCLMHMRGTPQTMHTHTNYGDVVHEVMDFLLRQANKLIALGLPQEKIILDPGFGFAKNVEQNIKLFKNLKKIASLNFPLLVGLSRKSVLGHILKRSDPKNRVVASVVAAVLAIQQGAKIVRVHDVQATHDAINVMQSLA